MKYCNILLSASITLFMVLPVQVYAAGESVTDADEAYKKRVALSNQIKKMRAIRKELPIPPAAGLFGVYAFPEKGQFVTGIGAQNHKFSGLVSGSDSVSAETAVTTAPNRFFGNPMQPPTLRVVPNEAEATVLLPYINYALNDKFAAVALAPLIKKKTELETFKGAAGTTSLGTNTVTSQGLGDIKFGFLYKAYNEADNKHNVIIDAVFSAPTGSITESDMNLTPMGTKVDSRLGYGMQLGSGTWDALLGLSYWGKQDKLGWGAQYLATIPLESENSQGWSYGDKHEGTAWLSYEWQPTFVSSARFRHEKQGEIQGIDPKIYGPGLGANPDNYGGTRTEILFGVNWMYKPARNLGLEIALPIDEDRNGIQASHQRSIMFTWRNAFF